MESWIQAQRIGLVAYSLQVLPVGQPHSQEAERFENARALLVQYLNDLAAPGAGERWVSFSSLPLQVLATLQNTLRRRYKIGKYLASILPDVEQAQRALQRSSDASIFGCVQVWAYHALIGRSEPRRLLKLARVLFGTTWRALERNESVRAELSGSMGTLRDPWQSTLSRCDAIGQLAGTFGSAEWAGQIESVLYHHQFCWPLLVLPSVTDERTLALSLPIALDVNLDMLRRELTLLPEEGTFVVNEWYGSLLKAVQTGKDLWRAKHGNHGREFREIISGAGVTVDFRVAEQVAQPLREIGFHNIELDGGSAEAYFAQVVLNRLLGRGGILASAATGMIGNPIPNEDQTPGLNREFVPPRRIRQKIAYVFASGGLFERVVLPAAVNPATVTSVDVEQSAEVRYAANLYTMADIMHVNGWRQHQYVRCPELAWGIHSERLGRPGLLDIAHAQVTDVLDKLHSNTQSSVLKLHSASEQPVASALWHINMIRLSIKPKPPPSLSWAFVRAMPWEKDRRFWEVVWNVTGASMSAFNDFTQAETLESAAELLAAALNRCEPDIDNPSHRAPDILVVLAASALDEADPLAANVAARPFMFPHIIERFGARDMLAGPFDERFRALLGATRIVCLYGRDAGVERPYTLPTIEDNERAIMEALAMFEFGFTEHTAALMLHEIMPVRGKELRDRLLQLVDRGLLREGQGWYHMPQEVRSAMTMHDSSALATGHFKAGCAMAPYATEREVPTLALDVAFQAQHVHEAERHLALALRHAQASREYAVGRKVRAALGRLGRFAEYPTWGLVARLLKAQDLGRDCYEIAHELIECAEDDNKRVHPQHWLLAARAAAQWSKSFRGDAPSNHELQRQLRYDARRWFKRSIEACSEYEDKENATLLNALTTYAVYLCQEEREERAEADRVSRAALNLIAQGADGRAARGEWYEIVGDDDVGHGTAAERYRLGTIFVPEWAQLWVKGIGAAALAQRTTLLSELFRDLDAKRVADAGRGWDLIGKSQPAFNRQVNKKQRVTHVWERWEEGRKQIRTRYGRT